MERLLRYCLQFFRRRCGRGEIFATAIFIGLFASICPAQAQYSSVPVFLRAVAGSSSVTLYWQAAVNATSYNIYRGTAANGESATPIATNVTSNSNGLVWYYTDSALTNGTTYYYKVIANGLSGASGYSNEASADPGSTALPAPLLRGAPGNDQVALNWTAVTGATSYEIYRSVGSGNGTYVAYQFNGSSTSFTDNALSNGATYNYYVTAVNTTGVGASSSVVSVTPGEVVLPAPTGTHIVTSGTQLTVCWNYVPNAGYNIYRGTSSGGEGSVPYAVGASGSSNNGYNIYFNDSNVVAGKTYYYFVTATNSVGESGHSTEASGLLNAATAAPPTLVGTASTSPAKVVLNWSAVTGATSYDIFRAVAGTNNYVNYASSTTTTYTDTAVTLGVSYTYYVDYNVGEHNAGDNSAVSNAVTLAIGGALLPSPSGLEASLSGGVTLTWNAVTGASGYNVYRGSASGAEAAIPIAVNVNSSTGSYPSPNYVDSTVASGSAYYYKVTAVSGNGESGKSNEAGITDIVADIPAAPTDLTASATATAISLNWQTTSAATSYDVYREANGQGFIWLANTTAASYSDSTVTDGVGYIYYVTAANTYGQSSDSNQVTVTYGQPAPPAPTGLQVGHYASTALSLTWNAVPGASSYNVYEGTTAGGESTVPVSVGLTSPNTVIGGLTSTTTYYFTVSSLSAGGLSAPSNEASGTPGATALTVPNLIVASTTSTAATLSWSTVTGATSYSIYRSIGGTSSFVELTQTTAVTYKDTPLTAGLDEYYYVVANSASGSSGPSNTVSIVPTSAALPAPTGIFAYSTSPAVTVVWNAVNGATSYNVYRGTATGGESSVPVGVNITSTYNGPEAYYFTDSSTVSGTVYYYKVTAVDNYGESILSSEASTTAGGTTLAAPILTAASGTSSIVLNWGAVTGATSYTLRRQDATGYYSTLVDTTAITYTDSSAAPGINYSYYVFANSALTGSATNSNTVTATVGETKLAAPSGLIAYPSSGSVYLYWNPVVGASSYNVYIAKTSGGEGTVPLVTGVGAPVYYSTYYVSNLTTGTKYYFEVTAVSTSGESAKSAEASATPGSTVLSAPTLTVSTASGQGKLSWSAVTGATSYAIFRAVGTNIDYSTLIATSTTTSATDSTPTNGLTYTYQVFAVSANGYGTGSNAVTVLIGGVVPPAPAGLAAYPTSTSNIQLLWNPVPGITSYNVYRSTTTGGEGTTPYVTNVGSPTNAFYYYNDSSVTSGTEYYYKITAVNSVGESAKTAEVTAVPGGTTLTAPILIGAGSTGKVTLSWTGISGATSYQLYRNIAGQGYLSLTNTTASSYSDSAVSNGVSVSYYVAPLNAQGLGASSNVVTVVPGGSALAAPTGLTAANDSNANIYLTWNGSPGATSYNIYRGSSSGQEASLPIAVSDTSLSYDDPNVVPGLRYYYKVTAIDSYGESAKSNETSAIDAGIVTSAPNLKAAVSGTTATLSWSVPSGATSYNIYRSLAGSGYNYLAATTSTTYTDTPLLSGVQYSYYVTAVGTGGQSPGSNVATVTAGSVLPPAPFGLYIFAQSNYLVLDWDPVPGASNYNIYRGTSAGGEASTPYNVGYSSTSNNGQLAYFTDGSVSAGTTYYYYVTATSAAGESAKSNEASATPDLSRMLAPTLTGTTGSGQIILNWSSVPGAASYELFRSVNNTGNYSFYQFVSGTSYTDTAVTSGASYGYIVCAVNTNGQGNDSNVVALFAGGTAPGAPTNVYVDVQHGNTLYVIWQGVPAATSYNVYRSTTSGGEGNAPIAAGVVAQSGGVSSFSFQDTTAVLGVVYYYEVTAVSPLGESAKSMETTGELGGPSIAPSSLSATTTTSAINLTWSSSPGATKYFLLKAIGTGQYTVLTSSTTLTYTDTAVQSGISYSYYVMAANTYGVSGSSNVVTISTNGTLLSPPVGVEAFPYSNEIGVAWNTVPGATNYYIYRGTSAGAESPTPIATGGYSAPYAGGHDYWYDGSVSGNQTYYYYVTAINNYGQSVPSAETSAEQYGNQLPAATLTATPGSGSVTLNWNTILGAVGYRVFKIDQNNIFSVIYTGIANTYTDTSVTNGVPCTYFAGSYNVIGSSPASNYVTVTPGAAGGSPLPAPALAAAAGDGSVSLSWTNIVGANSYALYRSTAGGAELPLVQGIGVSSGALTTYTDTNVSNYTTYYYKVAAANGYGTGAKSNEVSATPPNTSTAGFLIVPTPNVIAISANTENTVSIGVNLYDTTNTVALTVTGLPANVTAVFDPAVADASGSYLDIYASASAAQGVYTLTITGTSGGKTESVPVLLQILPEGSNQSTEQVVRKTWDIRGDTSVPTTQRASLINEVGHLLRPVTPIEANAWKVDLHLGRKGVVDSAQEMLWLGEYQLAHDQQPESAIDHFNDVCRLASSLPAASSSRAADLAGHAKYDSALALFYSGAYVDARDAFYSLLTAKTPEPGIDRKVCSMWWRHGVACAGYHAYRAEKGIPEPPKLDPKCGVAALAACLRSLNLPFDEQRVMSACRVTGEGSSLGDLVVGAPKLGVTLRPVNVDDQGLMMLPKPLVAYVEHDHFVAVTKTDKSGVTYLCSDCGAWPGGAVHLTWSQWRLIEASRFAVATVPGSAWDDKLNIIEAMQRGRTSGRSMDVASLNLHNLLPDAQLLALSLHVIANYNENNSTVCGLKEDATHCQPWVDCPMDGGCDGGAETGPTAGDPVNLATGELEYTPPSDITVYNPYGPSIKWSRIYESLRSAVEGAYEFNDFGQGWSQPYNVGVYDTEPGQIGTKYVFFPNGARSSFSATTVPTAALPAVQCTSEPGADMLVQWNYSAALPYGYFTITFADRTKWITTGYVAAPQCFLLAQLVDRNGSADTFNYSQSVDSYGWPLLSSITNAKGTALLTIARANDGTGNIVSVSDPYNRSVYYHSGYYPTKNVPQGYTQYYRQVNHISQIVATHSMTIPDRWVHGYSLYTNGEGVEQVPYLTSTTVPSPTGAGTATSTVTYNTSTAAVARETDANGNDRVYTPVNASGQAASNGSYTMVQYYNSAASMQYQYTVGFDSSMDETARYEPGVNAVAGIILAPQSKSLFETAMNLGVNYPQYSYTYSDPNDPYKPSSITDGNSHTSKFTYDAFGNILTATSARGTLTTNTVIYSNFALGELAEVVVGTKSPTTYSYFEPNGLLKSVTSPVPGTIGSSSTVTTSYTYDTTSQGSHGLGNLLTVTRPGNNAATTETTTYNYTADGSYAQNAQVGQPLTTTDPLSHVTHYRYDSQGNLLSSTDAAGNEITQTFNIANQPLVTTYPATGQGGTYNTATTNTYGYPGGPLTLAVTTGENAAAYRQTQYIYGPEGELITRIGNGESSTYSYNARYQATSVMDGKGNSTNYYYTTAGFLP